ncbi:phage tail tape measure protein [Methylobacterium planeticum]|uniref:Phage tail tape measure protein n=1 Tax=Methylobacterium planeticum TaxID=2615211 RepID=A0A6N6MVB9_9HYPH|nr:phage tail tape measure protein [Methylobacterium planeticum]KAB1072828.1 phage tail tape measure protein [Methylobacterium planeticum]
MPETDLDRANAARIKQLDTLDRLAQRFGQSLSGALTRNLGAGRQLDGVLGSLAGKLAGIAAKAALSPVKRGVTGLVNGLMSAASLGDETPFARGGVVGAGRVRPFAGGGVVAAPTYFPMQGGTGLMGEAGPEAILPLRRGSDGRLGVAAGAAGRPVSVTVNIATPDLAGFRRSEAQVAADLARAVARGQRAL